MSEFKFCSNCRHFMPDTRFDTIESRAQYARCAVAPWSEAAFVAPELHRRSYCATARQVDYMCGVAALKYEPKSERSDA